MRKDPTEFRQRFKKWKETGEYSLPKFAGGTENSTSQVDWKYWDNKESSDYIIPFVQDKAVKLTNAGVATGAVLSTNMLDSIADNADRAGLDLQTALGLAVKESTLGNPTDDRTAWNLSSAIRQKFNNKYPGTYLHINDGKDRTEQHLINYHKGDIDPKIFSFGNSVDKQSILQTGFEFYKQHPDKYNPGQKNYQRLVDKRGTEVMGSPEVLKWLKERNLKKATGRFNRINPLLNESKFNLPKYVEGKEGGYTRLNGNPVAFDKEGNLIDQVTGLKGTMLLPDLNVTAAHPKNYRSSYDPELITEFTDLIPGVGDVLYGIKAIDAYNKGDYMYAGMLGAGLAAPTILSKPLKYIGKKISKFIPSEQYLKKLLEKYNNMPSNDLMLYPAFYGGLIGGLPGIYATITSDNLGEGTLGLAESIIGGGAGAGAGLRLALMLNKKGLKKYYNLTLDGIKPKLSKNSVTSDVLFNNKKTSSLVSTRMKGLKSGDSYALIGDSELSTDSSPLYYLLLARHKNIGDIHPVLNSAGEISYQKLNSYGHYHSIEDINRSILTFNKTTGLNLPLTRQIENTIYIPSVYITKR